MASQYSAKTFIRQVRGALLNRCLRRHGIHLDLDRDIIKPAVVEELYQRLMGLPTEKLRLIESDFAAITELATGYGTDLILREGRHQSIDLSGMFLYCRNGHERACWTFLEHPAVFALAECFAEMDRFGAGRWKRRFVGAALTPDTTPEALDRLAAWLRRSYAGEGPRAALPHRPLRPPGAAAPLLLRVPGGPRQDRPGLQRARRAAPPGPQDGLRGDPRLPARGRNAGGARPRRPRARR